MQIPGPRALWSLHQPSFSCILGPWAPTPSQQTSRLDFEYFSSYRELHASWLCCFQLPGLYLSWFQSVNLRGPPPHPRPLAAARPWLMNPLWWDFPQLHPSPMYSDPRLLFLGSTSLPVSGTRHVNGRTTWAQDFPCFGNEYRIFLWYLLRYIFTVHANFFFVFPHCKLAHLPTKGPDPF